MGNSQTSTLKTAIIDDNIDAIKNFITNSETRPLLENKLNRKGDTAVIYCARYGRLNLIKILVNAGCSISSVNREGENALDVTLQKLLPDDGDILHHHFCPYACPESEHAFEFSDLLRYLIQQGVSGKSLDRLILYATNNDDVIKELIDLLPGIPNCDDRIVGLLLQITVWYEQFDNLLTLLMYGANVENFWRASFMPRIQPSPSFQPVLWPIDDEGEYDIGVSPDSDTIQGLKLAFIQDWRADWNDGENPEAQFRAGLQLPPEGAIYFIRASSTSPVLFNIMSDIMRYLPASCSGPNLKNSQLIEYLVTADYSFTEHEVRHIELKFDMKFKEYEEFIKCVKSLRHISRAVIRKQSKHNVFYAMNRIQGVPKSIKNYITMDIPLL